MKTLRRLMKTSVVMGYTGLLIVPSTVLEVRNLLESVLSDERWFLLLVVLGCVAVAWAAWYNRRSPEPPASVTVKLDNRNARFTPQKAYRVLDEELGPELSDVELEMLRSGSIPTDRRLITPGLRADLWNSYEEKRYEDGCGDQ